MSMLSDLLPSTNEPDVAYNFVVLIGIRPFGDFRSVTGAGISLAAHAVVEGGRNHSPHLLPYNRDQVMKWGEVTLRWGTPIWSTLYDWADAVRVGKFYRRDVFVVQLNRMGLPTRLMRFAGAWPVAWKASPLDTGSSEWTLSELTLVYEDFNMILTRVGAITDLISNLTSSTPEDDSATTGEEVDMGEFGDFLYDEEELEEDPDGAPDDGTEDVGEAEDEETEPPVNPFGDADALLAAEESAAAEPEDEVEDPLDAPADLFAAEVEEEDEEADDEDAVASPFEAADEEG